MRAISLKPAPIQIVLASASFDDHRSLGELLSGSLWELVNTTNLDDGARALHQVALPIVLCDQALGENSLGRAIRHLAKARRRTCVIVLANHADPMLWSRVIRAGGFDLLTRPFEADQVHATLMGAYAHLRATHPVVHYSGAAPVVSIV